LSENSQEFSAKFSALDFAHSNNINYQYRLKGFDDFWREASPVERRATYTSLPSGDFTLEIKAQHKNKEINHKMLSIPITVLPKYYQTLWFKLLIVFFLICVLWKLHNAFVKEPY